MGPCYAHTILSQTAIVFFREKLELFLSLSHTHSPPPFLSPPSHPHSLPPSLTPPPSLTSQQGQRRHRLHPPRYTRAKQHSVSRSTLCKTQPNQLALQVITLTPLPPPSSPVTHSLNSSPFPHCHSEHHTNRAPFRTFILYITLYWILLS